MGHIASSGGARLVEEMETRQRLLWENECWSEERTLAHQHRQSGQHYSHSQQHQRGSGLDGGRRGAGELATQRVAAGPPAAGADLELGTKSFGGSASASASTSASSSSSSSCPPRRQGTPSLSRYVQQQQQQQQLQQPHQQQHGELRDRAHESSSAPLSSSTGETSSATQLPPVGNSVDSEPL